MEIIDRIEKDGLVIQDDLRFSIKFLEIKYEGVWKQFQTSVHMIQLMS